MNMSNPKDSEQRPPEWHYLQPERPEGEHGSEGSVHRERQEGHCEVTSGIGSGHERSVPDIFCPCPERRRQGCV